MAQEGKKLTSLKDLGEFGLIEKLTQGIELKHSSTVLGVGDDAAVLDYTNKQMVVTTDMLVEGVHFDLVYTPLKHLGYKAVAVNISDILAMHATPKQIVISLAMSGKFSYEAVELLYEGIHKACENYQVDLVGGDTTSSVTGLTLSITAIGEIEKDQAVLRSGAKPGDYVVVSGDLGAAYAGLQVLKREKEVFMVNPNSQPDMSAYDYILERQLKPEARKDIHAALKAAGVVPTSMIDVSDGLSSELMHICTQSECGVKIYEDKIPVDAQTIAFAQEIDMDTTIMALNGGEDYELLFTIQPDDLEKVAQIEGLSIIGNIVEKSEGLILKGRGEGEVEIRAQGWNAY